MAEATQVETENAPQAGAEAPPAAEAKTPVHAADFPEAPADGPTEAAGQLDILLDMDVPVKAVLGSAQIPVRRLLQLGPGAVLKLEKSIEAPADLYLKDSKFAEADVVVVDDQFAVRIKEIVGAGVTEQPADGNTT